LDEVYREGKKQGKKEKKKLGFSSWLIKTVNRIIKQNIGDRNKRIKINLI